MGLGEAAAQAGDIPLSLPVVTHHQWPGTAGEVPQGPPGARTSSPDPQSRDVCKFLPFPFPKSLPHPPKDVHADFPHGPQHNKAFPLGFWCSGITLSLQTFSPTPGLPGELGWSCQAPVKSCLTPRNAAPGCELRLPQLSLKWIFPLREDFFGLVLLKRNLQ